MDQTKGKNKEQLAKDLNKVNAECLNLLTENAALRNQVKKLIKVIEFLTKGE